MLIDLPKQPLMGKKATFAFPPRHASLAHTESRSHRTQDYAASGLIGIGTLGLDDDDLIADC